jgi:ubiquinone/menaquinone biosynthesis C-methylase UbiE
MEKQIEGKKILDVTCGSRSIWFDKNHRLTIYCDKRKETWEGEFGKAVRKDGTKKQRKLIIEPDIQCDFTNLPFEDDSFSLVVFDPPHIEGLSEKSWTKKAYGTLEKNWEKVLHDGFWECMRVLKQDGVLIFKWSETSIPTPDVIKAIDKQPLFGHKSGKKMNTNWLCFMKGA